MDGSNYPLNTASRLARIPIELIGFKPRLRRLRSHRVEVMKQDIGFQGQLQPILVVAIGQRFLLIDGGCRLEAISVLGQQDIDAKILPEGTPEPMLRFAEIMANIDREELTKLERADYLAALKETWADLNPSARHGGDRRSANVRAEKEANAERDDQVAILAICSEVAEKTGLSARSFRRAVAISSNLAPEIKDRIRNTWLEDHQAGLQQLAEQTPEIQGKICDLLFSDPPKAANVADALMLASGRALLTAEKILRNRVCSGFERMSAPAQEAFFESHRNRITEIFQARGWTI